ncbi:DUF3261 domain-containing protein [Vibrio sp. S17_S38]|uniref:DUF3261 domain-containing protein n=1 Tax=Vibrio sp. S17_S38 TaxID=2720229 RepID=UPI00167FE72C|nr:DUF3261 domain-containing protein [Vibrio sp. S17_S38]MBD1572691.1 DUF3261 domain-containing protein [Vibrio sp. S17_S38]
MTLSFALLTGCASLTSNDAETTQAKVEIAKGVWVALPAPRDLGYSLSASQLISVSYQNTTKQLPTQLQVSDDKVVLAGFSSWGSRILSLEYANNQIDSHVMSGLGGVLPQPEQVLFNLMITLWPVEVWQPSLSKIGWALTEKNNDGSQGKHRQLSNDKGEVVADIHYQNINPLKGDITFINPLLRLNIKIKTLQYK